MYSWNVGCVFFRQVGCVFLEVYFWGRRMCIFGRAVVYFWKVGCIFFEGLVCIVDGPMSFGAWDVYH